MNIEYIKLHIKNVIACSFSRSAGPGGQNVNKVNTKVTARLPLDALKFLSGTEKGLVRERLKGRINSQDEIVVQVQEKRNQARNRETALFKIASLVFQAVKKKKKRIRTRPSKAQREKRLHAKRMVSQKKLSRKKPVAI